MRSLVNATVGGVSRGSVALVLSLRVFFVKYLLSSWYWGVALRLRSLLRGSCFGTVVPWGLASFYRIFGGGAGLGLPGPARLGGSLLQSWCLGLGPGCLVCRLPSVSFPWVGSPVGFLGSVSTSWESLVPYSVAFDSFSSLSSLHLSARALPDERVGVLVWVFIHQPPCLLVLQHGSQVGHTGSPSLLSYNLLFILQVSILSEQMVFCVS